MAALPRLPHLHLQLRTGLVLQGRDLRSQLRPDCLREHGLAASAARSASGLPELGSRAEQLTLLNASTA
jgi:hypothetical protein